VPLERDSAFSTDAAAWQAVTLGQAKLALSSARTGDAPALRMDFDFKEGKGFVVARHVSRLPMHEDYAVRFRLRGHGPVNDLEIKLVDGAGTSVWRHVIKHLNPPARWKDFRIDSSEMEFAWGPAGGGVIPELGAIEIAIVAREGGSGTTWLSGLRIQDCRPVAVPTVAASSAQPGFDASAALGDAGWRPRPEDAKPWIVVDFTEPRILGGLIIDWRECAPSLGFRVRGSLNGKRWRTLHATRRSGGVRSYVYLPNTRTRFLRLDLNEPSEGAALRPQSFEFSRSIDVFWYNIARSEPRGRYPRWAHREQSLWTPVGTRNGTHCALMNEEGAIEMAPGSFLIEPMLWIKERLFTWADVTLRQELRRSFLPVPSAIWETADWRLRVQAEAAASGLVRVRYLIENLSDQILSARLGLLVRPFQVTPPWQSVGKLGGVSRIHDLAWSAGALRVNDTALVVPATEPTAVAAASFDEGFIVPNLMETRRVVETQVHDRFGFATGALSFELSLKPGAHAARVIECPPGTSTRSSSEPTFDWEGTLPAAQWSGEAWATEAISAALTATGHILATRSGPALRPGPRRYSRSWIRDGTIMSAALLRMGRTEEVRDFIRWYAPYQREDGFVPCLVDDSGPDWLIEHDSHGQLIGLIADYYRLTTDARFLKEMWAFVAKAVDCIEGLLEANGLLPVSVSHEGYLAQPVHSYWDDFWALRGLRDAVDLARVVGNQKEEEHWQALATKFAPALFASIENTRTEHNLDFIPGSVEWADFDPTATAHAVGFLDVCEGLDYAALERTFDRYLFDWRGKRSGTVDWANYSPYEIRVIPVFVRLGRRDVALELLRFFLSDRRPPGWNQWPEIAWHNPRAPAHVGDLPHTWIAAEYVLALRSLFAYERAADRTLVLAAGLAPEWVAGAGVQVTNMPTLYGSLSFSVRSVGMSTLRFEIGGGVGTNIVLVPPLAGPLGSVTIDGKAWMDFDERSVTIPNTPAQVVCRMANAG
jgi:hypothetical protein